MGPEAPFGHMTDKEGPKTQIPTIQVQPRTQTHDLKIFKWNPEPETP